MAYRGNSYNKLWRENRFVYRSFTLFILIFCSLSVFAQDDIQVQLQTSKTSFALGDTLIAGLTVTIPEKYHLYGSPMGPGIGKPLTIVGDNNRNIKWIDILKLPAKKYIPSIGDWVWAYEKNATFFLRGVIIDDNPDSTKGTIQFNGLICHTACIPVSEEIPYVVKFDKNSKSEPVFDKNSSLAGMLKNASEKMSFELPGNTTAVVNIGLNQSGFSNISTGLSTTISTGIPLITSEWDYFPQERKIEFTLWLAIAFGFIAGIILNFMPCVLPVIGIKILSFSQSNEGSRENAILRSSVFSAGILSVFLILASLASFAKFSWGEQFQNPFILIGIIVLIVLFALWMFEIFMFTVPESVSSLEKKSGNGLVGDFFRGVFATILATPCSGPFLGATLAWAFTQTSLVIFTVFVSIGIGMAFPYILLSSSKTLTRIIPKPGKWMIDFKNLMGFILIGFAVYLLIGLPRDMIVSAVGICVVSVFATAFYTRLAPWGVSTLARKIISALAAIIIASAGVYFCINVLYKSMSEQVAEDVTEQGQWVEFSAGLLKKAHNEKRNVVIDFTANWCMNCQYNKIMVLNSKPVKDLITDRNILTIKADLTRPNPEIEALMHILGSRSVPFLAVFPGNDPYKPFVMRDIINERDLVRIVKALPEK